MKHVTSSQKEDSLGSQKTINPISIVVFVLIIGFIALVLYIDELLAYEHIVPWSVSISGLILALFIAASIKIADQWEKAVILRMGKFIGLKGPGLFLIIPIIDRGYNISPIGSLVGFVWALGDGLIFGAIFAWLYNHVSSRTQRRAA